MRTFSSNDDNKEVRKEKRQLWVNEKQISIIENEKNDIKWSNEIKGVRQKY